MIYLTDALGLFLCLFLFLVNQLRLLLLKKISWVLKHKDIIQVNFVTIITLDREIFFSKEWLYLPNSHHMNKLDEKCVCSQARSPFTPPPLFSQQKIFLSRYIYM